MSIMRCVCTRDSSSGAPPHATRSSHSQVAHVPPRTSAPPHTRHGAHPAAHGTVRTPHMCACACACACAHAHVHVHAHVPTVCTRVHPPAAPDASPSRWRVC